MFTKSPIVFSLGSYRWLCRHARAIKVGGGIALALAAFDSSLAETIDITAADTKIKQGTVYLDFTADIRLPEKVQAALDKGVDLFFVANVKISRDRKWLPDKASVDLEIVRRISFHALTKKYVVGDLTFDRTSSFAHLPRALSALGDYRQVPLINQAVADKSPDARVLIRVRLVHNELPLPLRLKRLFSRTWKLSSDWHAWSLN